MDFNSTGGVKYDPVRFLASSKSKWCGWRKLPSGFQFPEKELVASLQDPGGFDPPFFILNIKRRSFKTMATRKRTTSESGAYMSQYDNEVEKRLQALEAEAHTKPTGATQAKVDARLDALEAKAHTPCGGGGKSAKVNAAALPALASRKTSSPTVRLDAIEARLEALIAQLS